MGHQEIPGSNSKVIGRRRHTRGRARQTKSRLRSAVLPVAETLEARQLLTATPGALDTSFGTGGMAYGSIPISGQTGGHIAALQSNGMVVQVGSTAASYPNQQFMLSRYTYNGGIDTTFGTSGVVDTNFGAGVTAWAQGVAIQPDGKIVVVGVADFTDSTGSTQGLALARYNTDGSLDTTFASGGTELIDVGGGGLVGKIALQSNGDIVVAGASYNRFMVARFTPNGALDTTFGTGGLAITAFSGLAVANSLAILNNGDILAVGQNNNGSYTDSAMACYTSGGVLDTSFNGTGVEELTTGYTVQSSQFYDVAVQANGQIIVCGAANDSTAGIIARFNTDGTLDTSFNTTGIESTTYGPLYSLVVQPDGAIDTLSSRYLGIERYNSSGAADTTFGTSGYAYDMSLNWTVNDNTLLATPDGKLVATASNSTTWAAGRYFMATPPTAAVNGPYSVNTQSSVSLSGAGSSDPTGEAITYAWDTNYNGTTFNPTVTGISPTFSAVGLSGPATRTIALQVTDLNGAASNLATTTLTINNVPPTVTVSPATTTVNEGQPVTLTSSVSDVDPTDTYTYKWHITDTTGQTIPDVTTPNVTFTPASTGSYTATLTVSDAFGAKVTASGAITSTHVAPSVAISGATPYASRGDLFTLNLAGTEVGYDAITSWQVNWGDGNVQTISGNPSSITHTYLSAASMTISATATDAYGTYSSNSISSAVAAGIYYDLAAANHTAAASINNGTSANIVDNNSATEWTSGNVTSNPSQWVYVDLGAVYNVSDIKLNWDTAYAGTYKIRISNDSCNWNDLSTIQNGANGLQDVGSLNGTGRYLLVQMMSLSTGNTGYALKDVYVYGSDDLATSRPTYGSVNQSTVANTVDTSNSTEWVSGSAANQWLFSDLGEVYNINTIKVNFDTDLPTPFYVYTSADESNWTAIAGPITPTNGLNVVSGLNGNGRYVMLSIPSSANGTDTKVSDFEVNGTYDLAQNRPVTVSSTASGSSGAAAVDGNTSTAWTSSAAGTQSIYTDLGAAFNVTRVTLNWGANYPSQFQIQVSPNASSWSTIYATSGSGFTGGTFDQGNIYGVGRYVRVLATAGSGSNYSLNEFSVYGSANLALLRPMTASTQVSGHEAPYASDQNPTTSWESTAAGTQTLVTDLGASFGVTNVTINFDTQYASTYSIAISSDNVNWTTLTTVTGGHAGTNQIGGLSGTGRYVKLTMTAGPYGFYQIDDLYIFGH